MRTRILSTIIVTVLLGLAHASPIQADSTFTFEGLPDSTVLTNQYTGLTFSNARILTAGISLDEFEFPPHSGVNVASDNDGSMTISFAIPISSFAGYFTYAEPLTLAAFDASNNQVATAASSFSSNEALSGDLGSSPNEFLMLSFTGGISEVVLTGDPLGGSFTLDDVTTTPTVPEPSTLGLFLVSLLAFLPLKLNKKQI